MLQLNLRKTVMEKCLAVDKVQEFTIGKYSAFETQKVVR